MRHLSLSLIAVALVSGAVLGSPALAYADPCRPGTTLLPGNILCTPVPDQDSPATPAAPAPAPHRSLLDRILGRNKPAPATPAPAPAAPAPTPAPAAPAPAPAAPAPSAEPGPSAPVVPVVILPAPAYPLPAPTDRAIWLHTCVDLYAANIHLLQLNNQALDVPPLAYVLFACATNPLIIPLVPMAPLPVVPGQPPAVANQNVFTSLPVTG